MIGGTTATGRQLRNRNSLRDPDFPRRIKNRLRTKSRLPCLPFRPGILWVATCEQNFEGVGRADWHRAQGRSFSRDSGLLFHVALSLKLSRHRLHIVAQLIPRKEFPRDTRLHPGDHHRAA